MSRLPLYPPSHPQSIGDVLDAGFQLFRATLPQCLPYGALLVVAGQLANLGDLAAGVRAHPTAGRDPAWWLGYGAGLLLALLLWSALVLRQSALASGRPSSMGAELRAALGRLPQLVALTVLAAAATGAGLLLLVVPGVYLMVAFVFAVPLLLLERQRGVVRALVDSVRLVRGCWGRTALLLSIVVITPLVIYVLVATIIAAASATSAGETDRTLVAAVSAAAGVIVGSLSAPFASALILAGLGDLSRRATRDAAAAATAAGPEAPPEYR